MKKRTKKFNQGTELRVNLSWVTFLFDFSGIEFSVYEYTQKFNTDESVRIDLTQDGLAELIKRISANYFERNRKHLIELQGNSTFKVGLGFIKTLTALDGKLMIDSRDHDRHDPEESPKFGGMFISIDDAFNQIQS